MVVFTREPVKLHFTSMSVQTQTMYAVKALKEFNKRHEIYFLAKKKVIVLLYQHVLFQRATYFSHVEIIFT